MRPTQTISSLLPAVRALATTPAHLPALLQPQLPAQVPAHLPGSLREAATLLLSEQPQARQLTTDELIDCLLEPLQGIPFLLGHTNSLLSGRDLDMLASAVAELIQRRFSAFRPAEICLALRRGASGEWKTRPDEVLLPSLPCIAHWLHSYQASSRADALKELQLHAQREQLLALPPANLEASYPEQVAELARQVVLPDPLDLGNVLYDWLKRLGAFNGFKTSEQYEQIRLKEARRLLDQPPAGLHEHRQARSFGEQLRRGWPEHHPLASSVRNACRKRVLREWLRYHAAKRTDLATWLERLARQAATHRHAA